MVADLVVVAVLLLALDRISRGALLGWLKSVRSPFPLFLASRYVTTLVAMCVIALCTWGQSLAMLGPRATLDTTWSGTPPAETETCFRQQRQALRNAEYLESRHPIPLRCPRGGGDFSLTADQGCPAHGRVP